MGEGTNGQTVKHFLTMHQSGLGAGPSEKIYILCNYIFIITSFVLKKNIYIECMFLIE